MEHSLLLRYSGSFVTMEAGTIERLLVCILDFVILYTYGTSMADRSHGMSGLTELAATSTLDFSYVIGLFLPFRYVP